MNSKNSDKKNIRTLESNIYDIQNDINRLSKQNEKLKADLNRIFNSKAYIIWQMFNKFKRKILNKQENFQKNTQKINTNGVETDVNKKFFFDKLKIVRPNGKKRIAYFTNQVLDWNDKRPRYGGGERYCLTLSRLLKKYGYEVDIYQVAPKAFNGKYYEFTVKALEHGDFFSEFNIGGADKFYDISLSYDHVIYNLPEFSAGQRFRKDALMICHGIWFDHNNYGPQYFFRSKEWLSFLRKAFDNPLKIVSVDTNSINVIRAFFPDFAEKMSFIPNFVDMKLFKPPKKDRKSKKLNILFPRRSHVNRGSRILSEILSNIPYKNVNFYWVGEGDGQDTQLILDLCKKDHRLKYAKANFEEMPNWYKKADITVIPTIACEGTSLSCIEALASGSATIATNVGGLPDLIFNESNGLLVNANGKEIAAAINRLIEDVKLRKKLQKSGYESSKSFCLENWQKSWIEILKELKWIENKKNNTPKIAILTKNAIHGGVESLVKMESDYLNANVIVTGGLKNLENTCPFQYEYIDNFSKLLRTLFNYDVVLYHYVPDWALSAIKASMLPSIEFVHRTDTSESDKSVPTLIATHSEYLLDFIRKKYNVKNVVFIPNAADTSKYKPIKNRLEKKTIGAVTSYFKTKGIDILINAWSKVKPKYKQKYKLVLYGAGSDLNEFIKYATKVAKDIEFNGPLSNSSTLYNNLFLYITAARIEGLPVSVLEALSCNIPVIASDIEGHTAINSIASNSGFNEPLMLFQNENPYDLALKIENFLENPYEIDSREFVKKCFSPNLHCTELKKHLEKIYRMQSIIK